MKMNVENLNLFYGEHQALFDVNLPVPEHKVVALIGPSGCGKSTFLRTLNRMNDLIDVQQAARVSDYTAFFLNGKLIEHDKTDVIFTKPHDKKTEDYITGRFG